MGYNHLWDQKKNEVIARFLPVGKDEYGNVICPMGHFTKQMLEANGDKCSTTRIDKNDCIKLMEESYVKWVEKFKGIIRESHLCGDMNAFKVSVTPTISNQPYMGSLLFDIYYIKMK